MSIYPSLSFCGFDQGLAGTPSTPPIASAADLPHFLLAATQQSTTMVKKKGKSKRVSLKDKYKVSLRGIGTDHDTNSGSDRLHFRLMSVANRIVSHFLLSTR